MARSPSPWFWESRRSWAVILNGKRHILGEHPEDASAPRKRKGKWIVPQQILQRYHALLSAPAVVSPPAAPAKPIVLSVAEVFEKFLGWCSGNRSSRTYEWSQNHIQSFINDLKGKALDPTTMSADDLRPFHIGEWVDAHRQAKPGHRAWGPNHSRGAIVAVQRAFSWAEKCGHLARSPIRHVEKPAPKRREQVLTKKVFTSLLAMVKDVEFRDVLEFAWETGCRVQELRLLEAVHYKPDRSRFELPPDLAKGGKRWRIIYLTPRAAEIVARLVKKHPEGPLFRTTDDEAWEAQNFNNRFCRLSKKTGVKYCLTAIRHSYCQRMLEGGADHTTVAALMGHSNAVMVSTTYAHMDQAKDFLRTELLKASGAGSSSSA